MCIGKNVRLKKMNVSSQCSLAIGSFIILPNIFGNQKVIAPKMPNRLPPNST